MLRPSVEYPFKCHVVRAFSCVHKTNPKERCFCMALRGAYGAAHGTTTRLGCVTGYQVIRVIRIFAKTYPFE